MTNDPYYDLALEMQLGALERLSRKGIALTGKAESRLHELLEQFLRDRGITVG